MQHCPFCITTWVDNAHTLAEVRLSADERRRLVAALLSRRHLILSGPAGVGKCDLAYALALSIAQGRQDHICLIQDHPWWAARTGSIARYVHLQTEFSAWRLANFMESVLDREETRSEPRTEENPGEYVVCVERMSQIETDFYFDGLSHWLLSGLPGQASSVPIRLIGTYDSNITPTLNLRILRTAALVHLSAVVPKAPTSQRLA